MKKLFYLLLAVILVMGLAACSGSQSADNDSSDAVEENYKVIATLQINTDGMGTIAYGLEGEEIVFDEDFPKQDAMVNLTEPGTYLIKAKPDDGWKFVKWTKDGEDLSDESEITVEVAENVEYIAVFEAE